MVSEQNEPGQRNFFRVVFDAMPLPAFIVDEDVRIQDFNRAAGQLLGPQPELTLHQRGGEAMHCIHAEPSGCGRSEACKGCVIRGSVKKAFTCGSTHRVAHKAELRSASKTALTDLLVTATPLPDEEAPRALLILEDVSELLVLRGLIPICSYCKKIRDDQQYWHNIDQYLNAHMNVRLTHGLCPTCFAEQMKAIEEYRPPVPEAADSP